MRRKKVLNVILKLNFGVHPGPVVRCANERQEKKELLKSNRAQQSFQSVKAFRSVRRLQEYMAGK